MMSTHTRIRDLEYLIALHEEGNVTRAAQRIGISQPAFTQQLRRIERRLRMKFFDRGNGRVIINACGASFMVHAYTSVRAFHRAINDAHESQFGDHQKLRVGASSFLARRWVELLQSVELHSFRKIEIEVTGAYTFDLLDRLHRHEIDLALVTSPPSSPTITSVRLAVHPFMIAMRNEHPLTGQRAVGMHQVAQYPWVFFERMVHPALHDRILRRMELENLPPRIWHRISQADQVPALLKQDSIVAWLTPDGAERVVGNGISAVPLQDSEIQLEVHLAALADSDSPLVRDYVRSFVKRVEEERGPIQLKLPIDHNRAA